MSAAHDSFAAAFVATPALVESRRAALLLHTVSSPDRQWLLERLPMAERDQLQVLVAELRTIGIPPAPELLDELAAAGVESVARETTGLHAATPDQVLAVIANEPAELVARLLAIAAWPWSADVLARIPAPKRQQVQAASLRSTGAAAAPSSALDRRLVELVEARLPTIARDALARPHATRPAMAPVFAPRAGVVARFIARIGGDVARSARP